MYDGEYMEIAEAKALYKYSDSNDSNQGIFGFQFLASTVHWHANYLCGTDVVQETAPNEAHVFLVVKEIFSDNNHINMIHRQVSDAWSEQALQLAIVPQTDEIGCRWPVVWGTNEKEKWA